MKPGDLIVTAGDPPLLSPLSCTRASAREPWFRGMFAAMGRRRTHVFTGLPVKIVGEKDRDAATA